MASGPTTLEPRAPGAARQRPERRFRSLLFGNLWMTLAGALGFMQAGIGQWVAVVVLGAEGLGFGAWLLLATGLAGANLWTLPILRRARQGGGAGRRWARAYMSVGVATLLLGVATAASLVVLAPVAATVSWLGADGDGLFRGASIASVGVVALLLVWGFTGGVRRFDRTHVRVAVPGLHPDHRGLRIAQLSDLHIGNGMEGERLDALVRATNALDADLIVLTGDLFDFDPAYVEDGARRLGGLRARLGVYTVLGNHDTYTGSEHVVSMLGAHAPGMRVLRDELVPLPLEAPLYLAGIEDPGRDWTARDVHMESLDRIAAERPEDGPTLLLVHRPEAFPQAAGLGFPLVLAGHTHGGQIALPWPGGRINLARIITRFSRGLYREGESALYVNRGAGIAGPAIRVACSREIATIELQ